MVTVSTGLSPPPPPIEIEDSTTFLSVYLIKGNTLPLSLRATTTSTDLKLSPLQQASLSLGDDWSKYFVTVKSWWFGLPEVRSVLLMSPVICMATPWLNDNNSICLAYESRVLVPGISGSNLHNNTSICPPFDLVKVAFETGAGSPRASEAHNSFCSQAA